MKEVFLFLDVNLQCLNRETNFTLAPQQEAGYETRHLMRINLIVVRLRFELPVRNC